MLRSADIAPRVVRSLSWVAVLLVCVVMCCPNGLLVCLHAHGDVHIATDVESAHDKCGSCPEPEPIPHEDAGHCTDIVVSIPEVVHVAPVAVTAEDSVAIIAVLQPALSATGHVAYGEMVASRAPPPSTRSTDSLLL